MKRSFRAIAFVLAVVLLAGPVFAADPAGATPVVIEPYTKDEFPSWAKDLRRAEIITLGSLPFTTLTVTLVYSLVDWARTGFNENAPNLFSRTTDSSMTQETQLNILFISLGVSVAVGLVDLFVNVHKRKTAQSVTESGGITVTVETVVSTGLLAQTATVIESLGHTAGDDVAAGAGGN